MLCPFRRSEGGARERGCWSKKMRLLNGDGGRDKHRECGFDGGFDVPHDQFPYGQFSNSQFPTQAHRCPKGAVPSLREYHASFSVNL